MIKLQKKHHLIPKIPGQIYLWLAILIFGASSAVTRKLTEIGDQHFLDGRNPISLCNVLFVGNLCALLVLLPIQGKQWNQAALKQFSRKDWFTLTTVAILSGALVPGLIFHALSITEVNNIILVGRLGPPLTMGLSVWLLGERVTRWEVMGAFVAFVGVALTILLQSPGAMMNMGGLAVGLGELLSAIAAIASAVSTIIIKKSLSHIPLGIFSIYRTALGTIIFFITALILYGSDHFMDVFSPFLWQWMLVYGAVIVVLGQSFWLKGLRNSTVSAASLVGSFTPIIGILAAYLVLGEAPTLAQYIGGSLIFAGIFLSHIGVHRIGFERVSSIPAAQNVETGMGFKGL
ncbi:DMT family transporter [Cronbergia sp. UHCC 0137]|uniref:DMT family transporter n=1 Tax=Cronbergia sp. UHCC 0137 TaxID=3110239 RepID=UPI002B1FC838|nr:DMT family transporter [Cronbergia sp. UHCC 0137]MEA5618001.1 DMT family transporter [Cronbergia sp. UHCC 0137]